MVKERGRFVLLEGAGGSGKSTVIGPTRDYLVERGESAVVTREPGGIESAEQIRELVFKVKENGIADSSHQMALFFAARYLWMKNEVIEKLESGIWVVSDRSYPSTGAYQGYGEGGDLDLIEEWAKVVMGKYMPDAILLLDVSVETAMERAKRDDDPFDDEGRAFVERVVNGYREMAKNNWSGVDWYVVDAEQSVDEVVLGIQKVIGEILGS